MTKIVANAADNTVLSNGNPLPLPIDLSQPFDNSQASLYFESLESMHVKLDDAAVVGPTDDSDGTWVVRSDLGLPRVFPDDPFIKSKIIRIDYDGILEIQPEVKVGDRVLGLQGTLD
jgi:hypothetical protein